MKLNLVGKLTHMDENELQHELVERYGAQMDESDHESDDESDEF